MGYLLKCISILFLFTINVYAHPGNTASDGCHYCRTNCDYWGEEYGQRHCHGSSSDNYEDEEDNTIYWILGAGGSIC